MPSRTAVRWATWELQGGRIAGALPEQAAPDSGAAPAEFPDAPVGTAVELLINSVWVDVTAYVFGGTRDRITVRRGRSAEGSVADRSTCTFSLNNRDGRFSPRNPTGPYYGLIGRNTQVRVSVTISGQRHYRFWGEMAAWPQQWDITGTDVWVPVEAAGIVRRLGTGATPLKSTLYRGYTTLASTGGQPARAYWPLEDAAGSTSIASALAGKPAMMITFGSPTLATSTEFDCSAPLLQLNNCVLKGRVPAYTGTGRIQVRWLLAVPDSGTADGSTLPRILCTGTLPRWDVVYTTGGNLALRAYDSDGTNIVDTGPVAFGVNGALLLVSVELAQDGTSVDYALSTLEVGAESGLTTSGTVASRTVDRCTDIHMGNGAVDDVTVGHILIQSEITSLFDQAEELAAWAGETAGRRIERLCEEESIALHVTGDLDDTERMGAQGQDILLNLAREAETADLGILHEPRHALGLAYRTRASLYNQDAALTLDYPSHELDSLEPLDDDQTTRNDVTATRQGGSSARVALEDGPLSIQDPPAGVGRYDEGVTVNVQADGQLPHQAGWRVRLGTVDEARYPVLGLNLANPAFTGNAALTEDAILADLGDRIALTNPPAWLPPDDITQLLQGATEALENFGWRIDVNCSPASPWEVAVYDTDRYSPESSTLTAAVSADALTLTVATSVGPVWTTAAEDLPLDIRIGGEVITISGITGTSSPQTFTASARAVNGVTKGHAADAAVELAQPAYYAL